MKKLIPHFLVLLLYSVLTAILTYPQIRHMKQGLYVLSDQLFYAWMIERNIESFLHKPLNEFFNASIFYPYQNTLSFGDHLLGETLLALPFYLATNNPIFAQNVLILASFVLSAYGMFLLVRHYTNNFWIGIVGGILFSFSHVRFNQYDHLNILSTQWLPFIFLFLQRYLERWKVRDLLLLSLFYLLTISLTVYYLVMVSLAMGVYVLGWLIFNKVNIKQRVKELFYLFISLGLCVAVIVPSLLQYFSFSSEFPDVKRIIQDNIIYSANVMSYFMTARSTIASQIAGSSSLSESDAGLFPGLVVLASAFFAIVYGLRKKGERLHVGFLASLSFIFFLLSFGPFLKFTSQMITSLPMPYFYLYYFLFPLQIMRVPARFAIFAELFLVVLACYGIYFIFKEFISPKRQWVLLVIVSAVAMIETWSVPMPLVLVETKQDFPKVYHWLEQQPENTTVLELPIPNKTVVGRSRQRYRHGFMQELTIADRDDVEAYRNYFSLLHGKRTVNGYSAYAPPLYIEAIMNTEKFPEPASLESIKKMGVDYVIVHTGQYFLENRKQIERVLAEKNSIEIIERFGDDIVIRIK